MAWWHSYICPLLLSLPIATAQLGQNQILCGYTVGFLECDPDNPQGGAFCSRQGVCGSTPYFQGYGNGGPDSVGPKTPRHWNAAQIADGRCGIQNSGVVCDNSPTGYGGCCSAKGYCGRKPVHCDVAQGCQSGCSTQNWAAANRCGAAFGGRTCANSPWGPCCSQKGFCGKTAAHCLPTNGCLSGCDSSSAILCPNHEGCPGTDSTLRKVGTKIYEFHCDKSLVPVSTQRTSTGTFDQCAASCASSATCKGISYHGGDCYLVTVAPTPQSLQAQACWSSLILPDPALLKGDKGDKGDPGTAGLKGDKGDPGSAGLKGDKGDRGFSGTKGDKGDRGIAGAKGDKGDRGLTGPKGDRGPAGPKGDRGPAGPRGPRGPAG